MSATDVLIPVISAATGLVGVYIGGWLSDRREREKRQTDFTRQQLVEFYVPLLGTRAELHARSELLEQVLNEVVSIRERLFAEARQISSEDEYRVRDERTPEFAAAFADNARIKRERIIPAYQQMLATFRDKIWLAEPETRTYFTALVNYVAIVERELPGEVVVVMDHTEESLRPFYAHLEEIHDRLRRELIERRRPYTLSLIAPTRSVVSRISSIKRNILTR